MLTVSWYSLGNLPVNSKLVQFGRLPSMLTVSWYSLVGYYVNSKLAHSLVGYPVC